MLDSSTPNQSSVHKWDILEQWQKLNGTSLRKQILEDLPIWSEEDLPYTSQINLFSDTHNSCHIRFKNGVVKITKDKIEMIDSSKLNSKGAVWVSSIINRNITLDSKLKGLFVKFATLGMMYYEDDTSKKDWRKDFHPTEYSIHQFKGMKTSYGYLIHTHNTPDVSKSVLWIDAGSDLGRPEGGNGKSVVMKSVEHFKKTVVANGKKWRHAMDCLTCAIIQPYISNALIIRVVYSLRQLARSSGNLTGQDDSPVYWPYTLLRRPRLSFLMQPAFERKFSGAQ